MSRINTGMYQADEISIEETNRNEWTATSADGKFKAVYYTLIQPQAEAYNRLANYNAGWAEGYTAALADLRDMGLINTGIKEHN